MPPGLFADTHLPDGRSLYVKLTIQDKPAVILSFHGGEVESIVGKPGGG